jgi:hypothetical protein
LSSDGDHQSATVVAVIWLGSRLATAVGGSVSGQAAVATIAEAMVEWLPAASTASTPTEYVEPQVRPPNV